MKTNLFVFVPVEEDWYPSFQIKWQGTIQLVRVTLHRYYLKSSEQSFRVSVWGADDCGMEKDYLADELLRAQLDWLKIVQQKKLTKEWLLSEGFIYC